MEMPEGEIYDLPYFITCIKAKKQTKTPSQLKFGARNQILCHKINISLFSLFSAVQ